MDARGVRFERLERIGDRLEDLVVDPHLRCGLTRMELRIGDDHGNEITDAARHLACCNEDWKIGHEETGPALTGYVPSREDANDTWTLRRFLGMNREDSGPRMLRQHYRTVKHARHAHVVHVRTLAEYLLDAADSRVRFTDPMTLAGGLRLSFGGAVRLSFGGGVRL